MKKNQEKTRTSNTKKTRIQVGKQKDKLGIKRHIRGTLKAVVFFNLLRVQVCGVLQLGSVFTFAQTNLQHFDIHGQICRILIFATF